MKCLNCGAEVRFDPASQGLVCDSCGTSYDLNSYDKEAEKVYAEKDIDATLDANNSPGDGSLGENPGRLKYHEKYIIYHCQSCGAELMGAPNEVAPFCHYCGSQNMIQTGEEAFRPATVIPFQLTKEQAITNYVDTLSKVKFLPPDLKQQEYLNGFRGIYIPYYRYNYDAQGNATLSVSEDRNVGGRRHEVTEYENRYQVSGSFHVNDKDAELALDDSITQQIAPYENGSERYFRDGYIAGFYTDRPDVSPDLYKDKAWAETGTVIQNRLYNRGSDLYGTIESSDVSGVQVTPVGVQTSIRPTWFLTWKKGNRMLYSVMNGQTGKLFADIPIDFGSYFRMSLLVSLIMFVVMWIATAFITVTPAKSLLLTASIIDALLILAGRNVAQYEKRLHSAVDNKVHFHFITSKSLRLGSGDSANYGFIIFLVILMVLSCFKDADFILYLLPLILGIMVIVMTLVPSCKAKSYGQLFIALIGMLLSFITPIAAAADLPQDYIYYGVALVFIVLGLLSTGMMFHRYNLLATHPVPNFFTREGGNNGRY